MSEDNTDYNVTPELQLSRDAVKLWQSRIKDAKEHWSEDFERMRENQAFAFGKQWPGQSKLHDDRYSANMTLRMVAQKVATLYARNPQINVLPRPRMYFRMWDEDEETIADAMIRMQNALDSGIPDPEAMAIINDYSAGQQQKKLIKKVCETLKLVYQYQTESCRPEFKEQMKQLVRRAITCGVGYVRVHFIREQASALSTTEAPNTLVDRLKLAKELLGRLNSEKLDETDPQVETLRSLFLSANVSSGVDEAQLSERLEFDFLPATSVIPDPRCRALKEFVFSRFLAIEYILPVDEVNAFFGTEVTVGSDGAEEVAEGAEPPLNVADSETPEAKVKMVRVWEVLDMTTKTHFYIADGWKDYLQEPEPLTPPVAGFWPLQALTFNDIEAEPDTDASVFPPSDVDLIRSAQMEWNRTRDALRDQRAANAPKYPIRKGSLTANDKEAIQNAEPNAVIELEGIPADVAPENFIKPLQVARIDPAVYDTKPISDDMMMSAGVQEANLGPARPDVTATVGTIAEQSRMTVAASNVDDLDGFLSRVAKIGCEMLLREMSYQTVVRVVGPGGVWPETDREEYLNCINAEVMAASSGRPNKALDIANFERVMPLLLQAGANPIAIIEEGVRRMDDRLDVKKFFPDPMRLLQQQMTMQTGEPQTKSTPAQQVPGAPDQPLQSMPSQSPVPLAAA